MAGETTDLALDLETTFPSLVSIRASETGADSQETTAPGSVHVELGLEIHRCIGKGGTSLIHSATQRSLNREVALKSARPELAARAARTLIAEALVAGRVEHPNTVPVHDIVHDAEGRPQIVMKRVAGRTWLELMRDEAAFREIGRGRDLLEWNLNVMLSVCDVMTYAHDQGLLHRDLKPANVMIGEYGEVYVLDWGLAVRTTDSGDERIPRARVGDPPSGTPAYMAPEMLDRAIVTTMATDVFLLGAVLFEILSGNAPYLGNVDSDLLMRIRACQPAFPERGPKALLAVCRDAMSPDPSDRPASVREFADRIQSFLDRRDVDALARSAGQAQRVLAASIRAGEPRSRLYALHGEARAGWRQVLVAFPGEEPPLLALDALARTMVEYELDRSDPDAAELMLVDLVPEPPELRARLEQLRALQEMERRELEALRLDRDPEVERRPRLYIALIIGVVWLLPPAVGIVTGYGEAFLSSYPAMTGLMLVFLFFQLVTTVVTRGRMWRSTFNARYSAAVLVTNLAQLLLEVGGWIGGWDALATQAFLFFLWAFVAAMLAAQNWRGLPTVLVNVICFLVCVRNPHAILPCLIIANAVLALNAVVIWGSEVGEIKPQVSANLMNRK